MIVCLCCCLVGFPPLDPTRIFYRLIKAVKILTVRFGENLGIDMIYEEEMLNCEKNDVDNDSCTLDTTNFESGIRQ